MATPNTFHWDSSIWMVDPDMIKYQEGVIIRTVVREEVDGLPTLSIKVRRIADGLEKEVNFYRTEVEKEMMEEAHEVRALPLDIEEIYNAFGVTDTSELETSRVMSAYMGNDLIGIKKIP